MNNIKLTIMCMVYKENGEFLVQDRLKNDWPGITFPGGKVEKEELIEESCIREMKEETGLTVSDLECMGYFEWNTIEQDVRHLSILYRTKSYTGNPSESNEGKVFFIKEESLNEFKLSSDFEPLLDLMMGRNIKRNG